MLKTPGRKWDFSTLSTGTMAYRFSLVGPVFTVLPILFFWLSADPQLGLPGG